MSILLHIQESKYQLDQLKIQLQPHPVVQDDVLTQREVEAADAGLGLNERLGGGNGSALAQDDDGPVPEGLLTSWS